MTLLKAWNVEQVSDLVSAAKGAGLNSSQAIKLIKYERNRRHIIAKFLVAKRKIAKERRKFK